MQEFGRIAEDKMYYPPKTHIQKKSQISVLSGKVRDVSGVFLGFSLTKPLINAIMNVYIPFATGGIVNGKGTG